MELASNTCDSLGMTAYTTDKSFRTSSDPMGQFEYEELPDLF
jgi:hypothetical protein